MFVVGKNVKNAITQQTRQSLCSSPPSPPGPPEHKSKLQSRTPLTLSNSPLNVGIKRLVVVLRIWFRLAWDTWVLLSTVLPFDPQSLVFAGVAFFSWFLLSWKRPPSPATPPAGQREEGKRSTKSPKHWPSAPTGCRRAVSAPLLHSGKLRSELPALGEGPYLSAPLPMAAHLREPRSQSPRSSSLGLYPLVKEFSSLRESYLWPTKSATFCSVAAHCHDPGGLRAARPPPNSGPMWGAPPYPTFPARWGRERASEREWWGGTEKQNYL